MCIRDSKYLAWQTTNICKCFRNWITRMINEKDRLALIEYRLQQASETIELAKFLSENQKFVIAVNRIYYGMYYALTALALKCSFETSKHLSLIHI